MCIRDSTYGVASFNVSPSSFGKYFSKLGCFCFEKQKLDKGEKKNLIKENPEKVKELLKKLNQEVSNGRATPGNSVKNDRLVKFLHGGVSLPE